MKHSFINLAKVSAFSFLLIPVTSVNTIFPAVLPPKLIDKPALLFEASYKPQRPQISGTVAFQTYQPPKPKPAVIPAVAKPESPQQATIPLDELFNRYANEYGVSKETLIKIAKCESGLNPNSKSVSYAGLFQFAASTWSSNRKAMGLDPNPQLRFNPEEAIKTAAFKISRDGTGAWPVCSR